MVTSENSKISPAPITSVIQPFREWCANSPPHDLLSRSQRSKSVSLAKPCAKIFHDIRTFLAIIFREDSFVENLWNVKVESYKFCLTSVMVPCFPQVLKSKDTQIAIESMKRNMRQLWEMVKLVVDRVEEIGVSTDDTDFEFFTLAFEKVNESSPPMFKRHCFGLLIHPLLFTIEERFHFINKLHRFSKIREPIYRAQVKMDKGKTDMSGWTTDAYNSKNAAVKGAIVYESKKPPKPSDKDTYHAAWRIGRFLRNSVQLIGMHPYTEEQVLEELERIFPHILSKLHLGIWEGLSEFKMNGLDYGKILMEHFMLAPGEFLFKVE